MVKVISSTPYSVQQKMILFITTVFPLLLISGCVCNVNAYVLLSTADNKHMICLVITWTIILLSGCSTADNIVLYSYCHKWFRYY